MNQSRDRYKMKDDATTHLSDRLVAITNKLQEDYYRSIYGNGNTNGVLSSFLDGDLVTEFESWELHDDEDLSSLVLSVQLLAVRLFV